MTGVKGAVRLHVDGDVATLTLVRTDKHNAISDVMWEQLTAHLHALIELDEVRVLVLRGEGSVFSAGADLQDMVSATADEKSARAFALRVAECLHALMTTPKVTIAVLEHHVRGAGAELALACDLRLAADDLQLQVPVARLGVVPDRFTVRRLLNLGGPAVARRVLLLAEELDATESHRLGLVDEVAHAGALDHLLERILKGLRANEAGAVGITKQVLLEEEGLLRDPCDMVDEFARSLTAGPVSERGTRVLDRLRR